MTPTRRAILLAAAAVTAVSAPGASQAFRGRGRRLLIDEALLPRPAPADARIIPDGVFLDPGFLAASPSGDYQARLTPANRFLLLEALRYERIPHEVLDSAVLFRKPSAKPGGPRTS